jgi:hypothetical protein
MDEKQNFHGYITLPVLTGAGRLLGPLAGATLSAWKHSAAAAAESLGVCVFVVSPPQEDFTWIFRTSFFFFSV